MGEPATAVGNATKAELLAPGTRLGKYFLLQRLAVGGMAELHLACAEGLAGFQKVVVIKHVLPHLATNPEFVQMFLNEARLAANLTHPNIVQVTDIGESRGDFYYVMEFVHGRNARELLREGARRGGLPPSVSLSIAIAAASALEHTHMAKDLSGNRLGLIHRDVSPSNLLISYEGAVKLTDFGIAKAAERSNETIGGTVKGKVGYMPPEQCRGGQVDQRSDIFALGVVLFELTTSLLLFYGDNDFAILNQVITGSIDRPSERLPGYSPELEEIVLKALAPNPDQRYQTVEALRRDLESYAHDQHIRTSAGAVAEWMKEVFGTPPPPKVEIGPEEAADAGLPTLVVAATTERSAPFDAEPTYVPLAPPRRRAPWLAVAAVLGVGLTGGWLAMASTEDAPAVAAETAEPEVERAEAPAAETSASPSPEPEAEAPVEAESAPATLEADAEEAEVEPAPRKKRHSRKRKKKRRRKPKTAAPTKEEPAVPDRDQLFFDD